MLAQFCSNDPAHLLAAAEIVADRVDGVDLNLGCPQRIAKRGRYGAFLMDDLPLVESMVSTLAKASRGIIPLPCSLSLSLCLSLSLARARSLSLPLSLFLSLSLSLSLSLREGPYYL